MVRPTAGAVTPPPVQSAAAARLAAVPAPPVQPTSGSESTATLTYRRGWRRPALAAALLFVAAFVAGRLSTWHPPADELANLPRVDVALDDVPKDIGEEPQVVEVAASNAATSPASLPESADPVSTAPVAGAAAVDVSRDVKTPPVQQPDVDVAKAAPVDTTAISSALNDEPNEPLLDLVAAANPQAVCDDGPCEDDRKFGTTLSWAETPDAAAELAREQGKLVFLIQVSGNFAREEFT